MRKADRLFQIIQILRRSSRPVTSSELAGELEVARRTVYRDIAHLIAQRVPIEGEAGFGYILDPRYDMPPLMLTPDEIEAVVLGVQMVARVNDAAIRNAAGDVMAKIKSVMPQDLLPYIEGPAVGIKPDAVSAEATLDTRPLRLAIREGRKLEIDYRAADGAVTSRIVWPVLLGYADTHSLLIAWCQSKQAFRHFRTERILKVEILDDAIGMSKTRLRQQWRQWRDVEMRNPVGAQ
ncbi:YafY family transcriptional regulator [Rhizobium lentis]|uniref:YafY family transcriptional regulator n=1 Tax=Rhizobium lentis TaxID=1138194 RepID=A0A9Q3MGP9_9HYPH|nr:YafY family protein [Rhizobium lentis]MBX4977684.1 YafY family transcriptional regulator [Rhizobium lentis]MBX5026729.1 YafY family transcriptional regulator [Rhizobium lentis]MBX5029923.1 YafY family transcriptional regulator [Rhizobium lentis]MBX5038508.1 YafY family transcriptional regulator [Rhizobium lentis]MBX5044338.1 YafY family transcriptional regulator [Rhizobium lentis]